MQHFRKAHILMIDDNPGDVELFRMALDRANCDYEFSVIHDGGEALAMVQRENSSSVPIVPDLILLDLNLPKADGREILSEMRSARSFDKVPVVILTSSSSTTEREELGSLRIARYVTKPPDLAEFLKLGSMVKEVLAEYNERSS
jgi:two-component system response regulator